MARSTEKRTMIIFVLCLFVVASVLWSQKKLMSQSKILRRQQTGKVQAEQIAVAAKAASPVKVPSPVSAWDYIEDANKYVSLAQDFPRKACPRYSHFLQRFTQQFCFSSTRRDTSYACVHTLQKQLDSHLNHSSSEWIALDDKCCVQAYMYNKRSVLTVGKWILVPKPENVSEDLSSFHTILRQLRGRSVYFFGDSWICNNNRSLDRRRNG